MKNLKRSALGLSFLIALLSGCEDSYKEANFPARPPELQGCKIYYLENEVGREITVVRCPNSDTSTTYKQGRTAGTTVVIDEGTTI
jgi:hypothetical protein